MLLRFQQSNFLAYATTTIAANLMNSVFQFYYVNLFLNQYKISIYWFNAAQTFYLVWNSINDPLFGYLQDNSSFAFLKHRRLNILYGAPLFSLSFLLPWFGWVDKTSPEWLAGVHLIVSLFFYDSMFTFVLLAQCSLFTEISRNQSDRQTLLFYSQIGSIIGSSSVLLTEVISNHMQNIHNFQITCVVIALISWCLMSYTGYNIKTSVNRSSDDEMDSKNRVENWKTAMKTWLEILKNKNFISFVIMNFFQVFHYAYCTNFFSIFRKHIIGADALPSIFQSLMAGGAFILPSVAVLMFSPLILKYGSYYMIKLSFLFKILIGGFFFMFGYTSPWLVAAFMILDSTIVSATFSLFNLSVSDIIDHDQICYNRSRPVSSMIFGLNALITKPAQSLAPVIILFLLNKAGYKNDTMTDSIEKSLSEAMFSIMVFVPIIIGVLQFLLWNIYSLRNTNKDENELKFKF
ncbi:transmembrane protein 180 isoform X1 [Hydra vulgaris]|uniref:transmembrane protein 180 isoform X1 n=1 Tax=Hydra vulgaris TaxID=6087 RepID=UPI0006414472|nr:transmembrane protein 180 [Hydra vulgaris]